VSGRFNRFDHVCTQFPWPALPAVAATPYDGWQWPRHSPPTAGRWNREISRSAPSGSAITQAPSAAFEPISNPWPNTGSRCDGHAVGSWRSLKFRPRPQMRAIGRDLIRQPSPEKQTCSAFFVAANVSNLSRPHGDNLFQPLRRVPEPCSVKPGLSPKRIALQWLR